MLLHQVIDLAEADAVLARARAPAGKSVVDDVVDELARGRERVGGHLDGDMEVAVARVAEDAGVQA